MSPFRALLKVTFRNYFGLSVMKQKYIKQKKELWQPALAVIGLGIGGSALLSFYFLLSSGLYAGGKMLGQPALGLALSLVTSGLVIFIFGVSAIIGTLYFTQDNALLASLPLKPFQVLAAKFSLVVFNQYLVLAFFLIPPLVIFAAGEGMGLMFGLVAVLVFVFFPVVPLAPAAALATVLMSRSGSKRLKDLFTFFTYAVLIVFGLGMQFFVQTLPKGRELNSLEEIIRSNSSLVGSIEKSFPPAVWATKALSLAGTGEGWINLVLFIGLTAVLVFLMLALGNRFFYRGLLAGGEVARRRRGTRSLAGVWEASSTFKALLLREHRLFLRTPVYVMNVLPVAVIVPFLLLLPAISGNKAADVAKFAPLLGQRPYLGLIIVAVACFIAGTLPLAPSALSREGRLFWFSQLIPVNPEAQITAKFWYILGVNYACSLPFFIVAVVLGRLPGLGALALAVLSFSAVAAVTNLGLLIDLFHPFFTWDNPQRAVKNNLNVVFGMLATLLWLIVMAVITVILALYIPWWLGYMVLLLIMGGAAIGLFRWLLALAARRYRELEV